nr:uncharacterized protein LOC117465577 [Pseudochaenichthys georgianus]
MTVSDRLPEEARSAGAGSPSNSSELVQLPATREEFMAAQFPEAIPLRKMTAPVITKALLKFFSMFGLPKVVQTDQDKKLGETNYVIQTPDRRRPTRVCHINMLKKYCTREDQSESSKAHQVETTVSPMASVSKQVGRGKVCPADAKIRAIASLPVPSTRRELRRFLGMAGYYRRFCRNFSSVAAPLTTLTSPSKSFVWSGECQQSFESLKGILCCTPVLSAPDFSKPFKLEVDASEVGTGAVLLQEDAQAIDHPVSYFSRKFNKHQLKYSTIEKEALALLFALPHFEVYLGSSVKPIKHQDNVMESDTGSVLEALTGTDGRMRLNNLRGMNKRLRNNHILKDSSFMRSQPE